MQSEGYTNQVEKTIPLTIDYYENFGISDELEKSIIGIGKSIAASNIKPQKSSLLSEARSALFEGRLPNRLPIDSPTNIGYAKRADLLLKLAKEGKLIDLIDTEVTGSNRYAKAIREYKDILIEVLQNKTEA